MGLSRYHAKRNFKITAEPRGKVGRGEEKTLSYVIQKHAARHLHYDFRLELDGVLLSWAIPKGPSLDPAEKRLAMQVEDHPLEYGDFEGTIPARQYGGGTVMVWDRGTWTPSSNPRTAYKRGHLKFALMGRKLMGCWALIKTSGSKFGSGKSEAWLLIKDTDEYARRAVDTRIVEAEPNSVDSKRSIEEIAAARDHEWHSNRSVNENMQTNKFVTRQKKNPPAAREQASSIGQLNGARAAKCPARLAPMLATLAPHAPEGGNWLHEVKYDGYRMLCRLQAGKVRMYSRNGKEWTDRFLPITQEVARLKAREAWLDGEACIVDANGRTSFNAMQNALAEGSARNLRYFVFDLMHLDGYNLTDVPLMERKRLLRGLAGTSLPRIRYSPDVQGVGAEVFKQACPHGFEGIVSKQADSAYTVGARSRSWLKVKCSRRQEMVIGGFTDPQGDRVGFGALLLGVYDAGHLMYAGKVGTGFDDKALVKMRRMLDKLERRTPSFTNPPRGAEAKGAHWVKPTLVGEVQFTEWSSRGALRHPSFLGLRLDKHATEVLREKPADFEIAVSPTSKRPSATKRDDPSAETELAKKPAVKRTNAGDGMGSKIAGVTLSHPDKLLFPEAKLSKLALAHYYEAVANWILPYLKGRPISLVRCPDGWNKECFYQKNADKSVHAAVSRVEVPWSGGKATYFAANSVAALVGLAQWGVLELHPWGSRTPALERPDRLVFDFDPADDVAWPDLVKAVHLLRMLLTKIGLTGFLKTTGGKGLHIVVPIKATLTWPQAKGFTKAIADLLAKAFPDRFTSNMSKSKRGGRIFIDYLRNSEGATAIAAYSFRARSNAPVSTPIEWSELAKEVRFDFFNVRNVPARLKRLRKDPWEAFYSTRQSVTQAMFEHVGYMKNRGERSTPPPAAKTPRRGS